MAQDKPKLQPGENQHIRLKLDQIKLHYADGLITAAGLLYYAIGIMRPPGQELILTVAQWLKLTGLKERTFYKAKAKLVAQGKLAEKVEGFITLKYESSVIDLSEKQHQKDADITESSDCTIVQSTCPIVQSDCTIVQDERPIVQSSCPIVQSEGLKAFTSIGSILSPDITNKSNTPNPEEGKDFQNFEKKKEVKQSQELPKEILAEMARLKILGGDRDSKVLEVSQSGKFSLDQVKGALAHVSRTWFNCENPAAIFLYQLPKQPTEAAKEKSDCEKLRKPMYVAGLVRLEELHGRYGLLWEDAARHFGHSEKAIAEFKELLSSHT